MPNDVEWGACGAGAGGNFVPLRGCACLLTGKSPANQWIPGLPRSIRADGQTALQAGGHRFDPGTLHSSVAGIFRVGHMAIRRMDNVGIVVDDLPATIAFFRELGLELEGQGTIEGEWAGRVTGLGDQRVEIAMMRTPDGHGRLELSRFLTPAPVADHRNAPVNALGYLRVMFAVDDIDDTLARLRKRGGELVGEVVQYEDVYRLCYIRGPEGLLIGLAEQLS